MMRAILCLFILSLGIMPSPLHAADGVETELAIYQVDYVHDSANVLLFADTVELVKGIRANGFLISFSIDLEYTQVDTAEVAFTAHVVTLGPPVNTYSRQVRGPYGIPARMTGLVGKNGSQYALAIRPIRKTTVDTTGCGWVHYRKGDFRFDPSANIDIHFVPHTTGDFYWNAVKALMEDRYRQFAELNKFTLPGKYSLYLAPCEIHSIIWDKRFGMMVDPTKSACYAIHGTTYNTVDPFLLMYASAARNYGYAPPFLLEGFAGYLSLAHFDMKEMVARKKHLPLASLLNTHTYMTADPYVADKTASSFVRYLIDQYKADRFIEAYRAADDLNLLPTLEMVYGKKLAELEREWLTYIDTVKIQGGAFGIHADIAEVMFNYPLAMRYRAEQLKTLTNRSDSLIGTSEMVRLNYLQGKYYEAIKWQEKLVQMSPNSSQALMALGSYRAMVGEYDTSLALLTRAKQLDTTSSPYIAFNLAMTYLHHKDTAHAKELLQQAVDNSNDGMAFVESRITLATLLKQSDAAADAEKADKLYREASGVLEKMRSQALSPAVYLWNGIASFGLGDTGNAQEQIASSIFFETRPFYQALGYLWLGKVADARGERDVAKENYRKVLELSSAAYHQDEARALLENRYSQ